MSLRIIGGETLRDYVGQYFDVDAQQLDEQLQPVSIDLTLASISDLADGPLEFDLDGHIHLPPGGYIISIKEKLRLLKPLEAAILLLSHRSTLFRLGAEISFPLMSNGIDSDDTDLFGLLAVHNPDGIRLQIGARIAQAVIGCPLPDDTEISSGLTEASIGGKLIVEDVKRIGNGWVGHLGRSTKDLNVYANADASADGEEWTLECGVPYLVQLGRVDIPRDQVWFCAHNQNAAHLPYSVIGGIGDPGFTGNWMALVVPYTSGIQIHKGRPLDGLAIARIGVSSTAHREYTGSYQQK